MPSIVLQKFGGLVPRTSPRLLNTGQATVASWGKLWSGELRAFGQPGLVLDRETGGEVTLQTDDYVRTIYLLLDKWLAWTQDVDVVVGFTTLSPSGHIFFTGTGTPRQTNYSTLFSGPTTPPPLSSSYQLGVAGPDDLSKPDDPSRIPLQATIGGGAPTGDPSFRYYVYTYYTIFNEESVPCFPSNPLGVSPGEFVNLTGFKPVDPVTQPTITSIRIYRTNGGEYQFVKEVFLYGCPADQPDCELFTDPVVDDLLDTELGEALVSQHYFPPPDDLIGLVGAANGSLAAFHGNSVMFSEPYQPGAWPPEYEKIFDYPVIGLGTFGQTVVVCTSSYTYLVFGSHPANYSVARVPDPYPCSSKRSIVSTENGVIYSSLEGLIFVGNQSYTAGQASGVHVLTRQLLTSQDWASKYNPTTMIGAMFEGRYFGFYTRKPYDATDPKGPGAGLLYDFSGREEALITGVVADETDTTDILIDIDITATAVFANPYTALHFVTQTYPVSPNAPVIINRLYAWESRLGFAEYENYRWRSKQFSYPYAVTFSVGKIMFNMTGPDPASNLNGVLLNPYTLRIIDGKTKQTLYQRYVINDNPFRLPSIAPRTDWYIEVEGKSFTQLIQLASSYQDLTERKSP